MYSHITIIKSQNNKFPKNRDFYLLDKEDNIKNSNKTASYEPDYIYVSYEGKNNNIYEKILKKGYFSDKYDLIKVEVNNSDKYINFIIPKNVLNDANSGERLLSEIKQRHSLIKEIIVKTKIDFNKRGNYLREISFIPDDKKFYNKIFTLYDNTKSFTPKPNNKNRYSDNNINNNNLNSYNNLNKSGLFNTTGNNIIFRNNNYEDPSQYMNKINFRGSNTQFNNNNIINNQNNYNNQNQTNLRNNYNPNNNNGNNFNYFRNSYNFQKDNKNNPDYYSLSNFNNSNNNRKPIILQDKFNPSAIKNTYNNMKPIPEYSNPLAGYNSNQTTPPSPPFPNPNTNNRYIFPKKGLRNIGSTCYMNATLQCLLHVNELIVFS